MHSATIPERYIWFNQDLTVIFTRAIRPALYTGTQFGRKRKILFKKIVNLFLTLGMLMLLNSGRCHQSCTSLVLIFQESICLSSCRSLLFSCSLFPSLWLVWNLGWCLTVCVNYLKHLIIIQKTPANPKQIRNQLGELHYCLDLELQYSKTIVKVLVT